MGALAIFEVANLLVPSPVYKLDVVSESGGLVTSSSGAGVQTKPFGTAGYDTLLVGGATALEPSSPRLLAQILAAHRRARRTASICTGAFILAEAGLLDGRRATTHWHSARELQQRFPAIQVQEDRIFVRDGNVWTSAGMTAYVDLMLAMVESDLGSAVSRAVARKMVVHHRRAGGQSQFSLFSEIEANSDRVQRALDHAKNHLRDDLSVESLAAVVHLSARQFSRAFRRDTGESPAKAIERLRVEAARQLVETTQLSIERIAAQTGFGDPERLRRAFIRAYGEPTQAFKRAAQQRKDEEFAMS